MTVITFLSSRALDQYRHHAVAMWENARDGNQLREMHHLDYLIRLVEQAILAALGVAPPYRLTLPQELADTARLVYLNWHNHAPDDTVRHITLEDQ